MDKFFKATHCQRCNTELSKSGRIMSKMNEDIICMKCKFEETAHPDYKKACEAELEAVKNGIKDYGGLYRGQKYPFNKE